MPKVGIMTEVSVEVYESVVVPAKGQKRFNRLVSQLLEAYYTSDKVRSIVDGEEALSNLEGLSNLQKQLQEASESVAYMGMVNETIQMGLDSAKEDIESENYGKSEGVSSVKNDDLEDFKREVLEGQKSFMEDMRSLMTDLMNMNKPKVPVDIVQPPREYMEEVYAGITGMTNEEVQEKVEEAFANAKATKPVEEPVKLVDTVGVEEPKPVVKVPTTPVLTEPAPLPSVEEFDADDLFDIETEPEPEANELSGEDILNNLLGGGGNSFNFGGIQ